MLNKYTNIFLVTISAVLLHGCTSAIDDLAEMHYRLEQMKAQVESMNNSLETLSEIMMSLSTDFVTDIVPIEDDDRIIGYTLFYNGGKTIDIMLGKDGEDGKDGWNGFDGANGSVPKLGVTLEDDGIWYWTIDGKLYLDSRGKKVMASGTEALIPKMKIEKNDWYVSFDSGKTWKRLCPATSQNTSIFKSIDYTSSYENIIIYMTNGQVMNIPRLIDLEVKFTEQSSYSVSGLSKVDLEYRIIGGNGEAEIEVITSGDISYTIEKISGSIGKVHVQCGKEFDSGKVVLIIRKNSRSFMKQYDFSLTLEGLSKDGTANCYMVHKAGTYRFYALYKGNSKMKIDGTPSSAVVLWESYNNSTKPSVGSVIKNVHFDGRFIEFSTPSVMKEGNALIGILDSNNVILWSWHIWVTKYDPEKDYVVLNSHPDVQLMDRNLGAIISNRGTEMAFGLMYQYGRKDPFLGSSSPTELVFAKSSIIWPEPVRLNDIDDALEYSIQHPSTFILRPESWNTGRWNYNIDAKWMTSKNEYDPCPPGWMIPTTDDQWVELEDAINNHQIDGYFIKLNKDVSNPESWYPCCGFIDGWNGELSTWGDTPSLWAATRYNDYFLDSFAPRFDRLWHNTEISNALPVRCVKQ